MIHVEYDLVLANVFTAPVTLTAIEVLDPGAPGAPGGAPLLRLEGAALAALTQSVAGGGGPPGAEVPAAGLVATVIDLAVPAGAVPARVTHRIDYALPPDAPARALIGSYRIDGPELAVDPREPVVVAPPLRGPGWFTAERLLRRRRLRRPAPGGPAGRRRDPLPQERGLRRRLGAAPRGPVRRGRRGAQRAAPRLRRRGGGRRGGRRWSPSATGHPRARPAGCRRPCRAPSDYAGNKVVVQQGPGVFATYAHLQPGSLPVRVGDRVTTGQALGPGGQQRGTRSPPTCTSSSRTART